MRHVITESYCCHIPQDPDEWSYSLMSFFVSDTPAIYYTPLHAGYCKSLQTDQNWFAKLFFVTRSCGMRQQMEFDTCIWNCPGSVGWLGCSHLNVNWAHPAPGRPGSAFVEHLKADGGKGFESRKLQNISLYFSVQTQKDRSHVVQGWLCQSFL